MRRFFETTPETFAPAELVLARERSHEDYQHFLAPLAGPVPDDTPFTIEFSLKDAEEDDEA